MVLTKRERVLVSALIIVILWALFCYFVFIPQYLIGIGYSGEVRDLQIEKDDMDGYLAMAGGLEAKVRAESGSSDVFFFVNLDDLEADQTLQQLAGRLGVELVSLELEAVQSVKSEEPAIGDEGIISRDVRSDHSGMVLQSRTVRMIIRGNADAIMAMADQIYRMDRSLVVTALDVVPVATESDAKEMEGILTVVYYFIGQ